MPSDEKKVFFELLQDEDEWPPTKTEFLWGSPLGKGLFRLNNVPFFAPNVCLNDVVKTKKKHNVNWFTKVIEPSPNSTLHVFCFDESKRLYFERWLHDHGCIFEYGFNKEYMAVNVPLLVNYEELLNELQKLETIEEFEYEFSCERHLKKK